MKKLSIALIAISLVGCNEPTKCVDSATGKYVECPTTTPESQTKVKYVTTVDNCVIKFIVTPDGFSNVYLTKCSDTNNSTVSSLQSSGKTTRIVTNSVYDTSTKEHHDEAGDISSLNHLVQSEQNLKQAISKLTLADRKLLLDAAEQANKEK